MSDRQFLLLLRTVLVTFSLAALLFALNSKSTMYEMVQNAYKVTLVSCIVPLAFGVYWKHANVQGAMLSVILGLGSWMAMETLSPEATMPPQLVGLAFSVFGMLFGSIAMRSPGHPHSAQAHDGAHHGVRHGADHGGQRDTHG